jgi:hypothetical protein
MFVWSPVYYVPPVLFASIRKSHLARGDRIGPKSVTIIIAATARAHKLIGLAGLHSLPAHCVKTVNLCHCASSRFLPSHAK